jgi:hypothetical protein
MTLRTVLEQVASKLDGRQATQAELAQLKAQVPAHLLPDWLVAAMADYRLVGSYLELGMQADESGRGVSFEWLTPKSIVEEMQDLEPGLTVASKGFLPIGACESGSGNPYFLDLRGAGDDPPVVRVRHDLAGRGDYPQEGLQRVAPSLSRFLSQALA